MEYIFSDKGVDLNTKFYMGPLWDLLDDFSLDKKTKKFALSDWKMS